MALENSTVTIIGLEHGADCHCCGRPLKYGINLAGGNTIGADCLVAKIIPNRSRWNAGKPTASMVRDMAKAREGFGPYRGRLPEHAFRLEVAA